MIRSGNDVEDLVEVICTKMFFTDFTVRRPKYTKGDGLEKEAADLLVPFGNYLLVFQIKSKIEQKISSEKSDIDFSRITRVANEAIVQLKTIQRIIKNKWLERLTTVKGYDIPFDTALFKEIIGIVVIDLIGEEDFPEDERTEFIGNYDFKYNMPIHVLFRYEFEALSTELDTLTDFIRFLEKRRILLERSLLLPLSSILDFLAFYKTNPDLVDRAIDHNIHLLIDEGIWKNYRKTLKEEIEHRDKLNEPSYFIDDIIDFLHTSVGFTLSKNVLDEFGFSCQGSLEGYLTIARELASLSRLERRILGERFLQCMKRADTQTYSYSMVIDEEDACSILVLSMSGNRSKRQLRLYQLCAMAYCYLNVRKIIGLASESFSEMRHSYDVIGLNDVEFVNHGELAELAKKFFSKPYKPEITEYKG